MASIAERVVDIGAYLKEQRETARLSVRQLASLTGVSNPYLSQIERGLRNPSAEVLQQLAKGLRISAEALYIKAGILDSTDRPDVESAIAADPHLLDRQRRVLLDIYTSFRTENDRARQEAAAAAAAESAGATNSAGASGTAPRKVAVKRTAATKAAVKKVAVKKVAATAVATKKAVAKKAVAKKSLATKSATATSTATKSTD